jgi:hypothetical protein
MSVKINTLTQEFMIKQNVSAKKALVARMYHDDGESAFKANSSQIAIPGLLAEARMTNADFLNSGSYAQLQNKTQELLEKRKVNAAQFNEADYYNLINYTMINLNRRILQERDLTSFVDQIIVNPDFTKTVEFEDFLPFGAIFKDYSGTGENVSLIVTQTGDKDSVKLAMKAVGWKDSMLNKLFNQGLNYMERVLQAVAEGYIAKKNDEALGRFMTVTYPATQTQAAITTGDTFEENMYLTVFEALKKLKNLRNPLDGKRINVSEIAGMTNGVNDIDVERAINGVINSNAAQVNRTELLSQIRTIIPYEGAYVENGKDKFEAAGVPDNVMYLFIPKAQRYSLWKRQLTQQITKGDALTVSAELDDRSWYYLNGRYDDLFFGRAAGAGLSDRIDERFPKETAEGFGFVIKVNLPTS